MRNGFGAIGSYYGGCDGGAHCGICGNIDGQDPYICADVRRDASVICVVEDVADLWALERTHAFKGAITFLVAPCRL